VNDAVIVVPVIVPQGSETHGPVPLWAWIVVGAIVAVTLAALAWMIWDAGRDDL
jgi:hypothetical protein